MDLITLIILAIPTWLSAEVAGAIATYVSTVIGVVTYFQNLIRKQRELYESKITQATDAVRKEITWEITEMKKDITATDVRLREHEASNDKILTEIKEALNQWKLDITKSIAEIKTILELNHKHRD
jgi:peptidoglycan hydrolase CwlO-like protein